MTWIEKVTTDFIITCGDGKQFLPLWLNATKAIEYNVAGFDFPNISGSLVKRYRPKGRKFNLELIFQGENHLDIQLDFEKSAADPNPWTITHPYYGSLLVQPTSLLFDNTAYNTTKVTVPVIETIVEEAPLVVTSPEDTIIVEKVKIDSIAAKSYNLKNPSPSINDQLAMKKTIETVYKKSKSSISLTEDLNKLNNVFNKASAKINSIALGPLQTMTDIQSVINAAAYFESSVETRLNLYLNQFTSIVNGASNLFNKYLKSLFEFNGSTLISAMCLTTVTNAVFTNRNQIVTAISQVTSAYNQYIDILDTLQSDNGGLANSYIPDIAVISTLESLVSQTITNLLVTANQAKQERILYCEYDTNIINLAYRLYGLKQDDSTITMLMSSNNFSIDEHLLVRKGRKIIYFV